ncbi:hypothetical protein [Roseospira visakhapatnamensis]|uniref:Uncharacterized protein n=1 Tax=Roseospira visakhapatnamensis TaxID=390880 RepID=A0A7W6RFY9_9PROT|nr:hypothetical protein [Roseospira visakhapatnamensis]MBB4267314.1 hypothetical protein [Roseospira visakhapatnamensis]
MNRFLNYLFIVFVVLVNITIASASELESEIQSIFQEENLVFYFNNASTDDIHNMKRQLMLGDRHVWVRFHKNISTQLEHILDIPIPGYGIITSYATKSNERELSWIVSFYFDLGVILSVNISVICMDVQHCEVGRFSPHFFRGRANRIEFLNKRCGKNFNLFFKNLFEALRPQDYFMVKEEGCCYNFLYLPEDMISGILTAGQRVMITLRKNEDGSVVVE